MQYTIGCLSQCYMEPTNTRSCSFGSGCCEVDVPIDMGCFQSYFNPDYNATAGCGYTVVMEANAFSYSAMYKNSGLV